MQKRLSMPVNKDMHIFVGASEEGYEFDKYPIIVYHPPKLLREMSDKDLRKTDGTPLETTNLSLMNQQNRDLIGDNQFAMVDTELRENFTNPGDQYGGGEIESDRYGPKPQTDESFLSQVL